VAGREGWSSGRARSSSGPSWIADRRGRLVRRRAARALDHLERGLIALATTPTTPRPPALYGLGLIISPRQSRPHEWARRALPLVPASRAPDVISHADNHLAWRRLARRRRGSRPTSVRRKPGCRAGPYLCLSGLSRSQPAVMYAAARPRALREYGPGRATRWREDLRSAPHACCSYAGPAGTARWTRLDEGTRPPAAVDVDRRWAIAAPVRCR